MRFFIIFTFCTLLLTSIAYLFLNIPGSVDLYVYGYKISVAISTFLFILSVLLAITYFIIRFFINIFKIPQLFQQYRSKSKFEKTLKLINENISFWLSKDKKSCLKSSKALEKISSSHPLSIFFQAEAYLINDDYKNAILLFLKLTNYPDMQFMKHMGLMKVYTHSKQYDKAVEFAQKALKEIPRSITVKNNLTELLEKQKNMPKELNH